MDLDAGVASARRRQAFARPFRSLIHLFRFSILCSSFSFVFVLSVNAHVLVNVAGPPAPFLITAPRCKLRGRTRSAQSFWEFELTGSVSLFTPAALPSSTRQQFPLSHLFPSPVRVVSGREAMAILTFRSRDSPDLSSSIPLATQMVDLESLFSDLAFEHVDGFVHGRSSNFDKGSHHSPCEISSYSFTVICRFLSGVYPVSLTIPKIWSCLDIYCLKYSFVVISVLLILVMILGILLVSVSDTLVASVQFITAVCRLGSILALDFDVFSLVILSWWWFERIWLSNPSFPVNLVLSDIYCHEVSFMEQLFSPKVPLCFSGLDAQDLPVLQGSPSWFMISSAFVAVFSVFSAGFKAFVDALDAADQKVRRVLVNFRVLMASFDKLCLYLSYVAFCWPKLWAVFAFLSCNLYSFMEFEFL